VSLDALVTVTVHPSSVLRTRGDERDTAYAGLRDDLARAAALL
jgi:hypothetical protein